MFYLDTLIVWALAGRRNQTRLIRLCIIAGMETLDVIPFLQNRRRRWRKKGVSEEAVNKQRRLLQSLLRKHRLLDCELWRDHWQGLYSEHFEDAPKRLKKALPWVRQFLRWRNRRRKSA
jgi:hypothetical protein